MRDDKVRKKMEEREEWRRKMVEIRVMVDKVRRKEEGG